MIFAHLIQSASNLPTDASALESSISALESAISALESEIKTLESSSVPWEHSVWVFTFLVVVGVAMELWIIRHEYRDDMEAWALAYFGVLRPPDRPSITKLSVEVGSVLLITIGIMGELGIGIKIASINGVLRGKSAELRSENAELRSKSDQLLALVTLQAGDAAKSAKTAHDEANAAGVVAKKAKGEADSVAKQAVELDRQLLASEAKRTELEKTVAPRFIPILSLPAQHLSTVDPLRKFSGMSVIVECIPDWEARRAAANISQAMKEAGLIIEKAVMAEDLPDGVTVDAYTPPPYDEKKWEEYMRTEFPDWHKSRKASEEVVAFLQANDWQAQDEYAPQGELTIDEIRIRVGFKPAPYFTPEVLKIGEMPLFPAQQKRVEEIRDEIKKILLESKRVIEDSRRPREAPQLICRKSYGW